jgi:putative SOS response-associated peptidase YedK
MSVSFTIVTQPAGAPLNGLHDLAPVVLLRETLARWLDPAQDSAALVAPADADVYVGAISSDLAHQRRSSGGVLWRSAPAHYGVPSRVPCGANRRPRPYLLFGP